MKVNTLVLPMILLAQALGAVEPTPWDKMTGAVASGNVTVTTNTGKKLKRTGSVWFTTSDVTFVESAVSVPRQDVKEVVIRQPRGSCCEKLASGLVPLAYLLAGIVYDPQGVVLCPRN